MPMPGMPAAKIALPQPQNTNQNVPMNSAASFFMGIPPAMPGCGRDYMPAWLVPGAGGGGGYANVAGKLTRCVAVNEKGWPNGQPQTFAVRQLSGHCLLQVLVDLVEETGRGKPRLSRTDEQCEILGHVTCFARADANILK